MTALNLTTPETPPPLTPREDDMKEFLMAVRQALLQLVGWIERRYGLERRR
jgi:hypothetical protein